MYGISNLKIFNTIITKSVMAKNLYLNNIILKFKWMILSKIDNVKLIKIYHVKIVLYTQIYITKGVFLSLL